MNVPEPASVLHADADLVRRRSQIRHRLKRANLAAVVILMVVIGLSLGAVLQAFRAERNAREAERSRQAAERDLERARQSEAKALLQQARAERRSGESNQRSESLEALARAASLEPSPALRDEAIAVLALPELRFVPVWTNPVATFFQVAPDFEHFGFPGANGEVRLLSPRDPARDITLPSIGSPISSFWFSPDGRFVAALYANRSNYIWNLATRSPVLKWGPGWAFAGFSPEGERVLVLDSLATFRCLALAESRELWRCSTGTNRVVVSDIAPQGSYFALAHDNSPTTQVRNLSTGELVRELPGHAAVGGLAWSLDGQRLAVGRHNGWLELWDVKRGTQINSWRAHDDAVAEVRFDPQRRWLASASWDFTIRFWSLSDFRLVMTASGYRGHMLARFSPDGTRLACARGRTLGYLEMSPSPVLKWLLVPAGYLRGSWSLEISPDGKLVAAGYEDGLRILDLATGRQVASEPIDDCRSALFTPDGKGLVTSGQAGLAYWPLTRSGTTTGGPVALGPRQLIDGQKFLLAALAPDGRWVAGANRDAGHLETYDLAHPTNHFVLGSHPYVQFVAASPDGRWLASGTWYGRGVKLWDTATRQQVAELPIESSAAVAFSPDSRLLVTSEDEYRVWECGTWRERYHTAEAGAVLPPCCFSPDGRLLAVLSARHVIELREPATGRVLTALQAPSSSSVSVLRFTPDSTKLVALEWARQIQVWDLPLVHQELAKLGLDWDTPPQPRNEPTLPLSVTNGAPATAEAARLPLRSSVIAEPGPRMFGFQLGTWFYILPLTALGLGVAIALYTLRYHRRMMHSYEEVDSLATERNQALHAAQAELLHSQKMRALGTLAAGIAHDFNNLLSIIRMGNNFLRRRDLSAEEKTESGQAVERAVEQGKQIVRSMLGYSREPAEEGETYSVPDLVNEAGLLVNQQFLRGITLTLELSRELPLVTARRSRLQQILLNLMVNASEAMNGQGRLRIAARLIRSAEGEFVLRPGPASRYVELVVEDTGPGIEPHIRERVFEPFFSTKPRGASSGTGLGLSLVHSLAEQEKIGIRLESAFGCGTVFTLWIPVVDAAGESPRQVVLEHGGVPA